MADPLGPYAIPDLIPLPEAPETPTILRFRLVEGALPEQVLPPIEVLEQGSVLQPTRLIQSVPADLLVDPEARAAASALPPLHSLARAWQLDLSAHPELVPLVFEVLADSDLVEEVWRAPRLQPPTPTQDLTGSQGYLEAASAGGVDAKFLWASPGGDGAGVRWIDIEGGWTLNHEDLPNPPLISGFNEPTLQTHGTNVLGVIAGVENGIGVTGIAHGATLVGCISIELGVASSVRCPMPSWRRSRICRRGRCSSSKSSGRTATRSRSTPTSSTRCASPRRWGSW